METIRFKTNIKCSGCIAKVTPFLNQAVGEDNWEVDLNSVEKVLTVVDGTADMQKIVESVSDAGYKAEKL